MVSTDVHTPKAAQGAEVAGCGIDNRLRAVEERLARLETDMKHFATKADLSAIHTALERHFNRLLRWGLGIMITATGALSAIIFGFMRANGN